MENTTKKTKHVSRKKIAFVYDAIYPYIKGGAERRYFELAKKLSKKGYEPHLYGMKFWKGPDVIKKDGIYLHGICSAKPLYTKDGKRSIWQAIYFGICSLKLIKEDFDIIDCCGFPYFSLFACKLVCLLKRKRLYSTWHEVWGNKYWKEYLGNLSIFGIWIEKFSSKIPDEIIAVSEQTAIRIKKELEYDGKIHVVANGIDIETINKTKPSLTKSDIIYVGRLMDFKNIDLLIKSVFILKKNKDDIKCIIIGDGPERNKLEKLTKDLNLTKNILFKGFLKSDIDVYKYLKSSKVFVLPSIREGFGIVVLEANACGVPVITINHKDNAAKDLINGKNGFIADLIDKFLAEKILRAIKIGKSMKQNCINEAKQYDWENIYKLIKEVYLK